MSLIVITITEGEDDTVDIKMQAEPPIPTDPAKALDEVQAVAVRALNAMAQMDPGAKVSSE